MDKLEGEPVSYLYERLLDRIAQPNDGSQYDGNVYEAVEVTIKLHKPDPIDTCGGKPTHPHCSARGCGWVWPCDTVGAIARALDVPIGEIN